MTVQGYLLIPYGEKLINLCKKLTTYAIPTELVGQTLVGDRVEGLPEFEVNYTNATVRHEGLAPVIQNFYQLSIT